MARWHANASQWPGEILGDGALERDAFAGRRVHERQLSRVEGQPVETELGRDDGGCRLRSRTSDLAQCLVLGH